MQCSLIPSHPLNYRKTIYEYQFPLGSQCNNSGQKIPIHRFWLWLSAAQQLLEAFQLCLSRCLQVSGIRQFLLLHPIVIGTQNFCSNCTVSQQNVSPFAGTSVGGRRENSAVCFQQLAHLQQGKRREKVGRDIAQVPFLCSVFTRTAVAFNEVNQPPYLLLEITCNVRPRTNWNRSSNKSFNGLRFC